MSKAQVLLNFLLFQIGWFGCVLGAAHHVPLLGTAVAFGIVGVHLWFVKEVHRELSFVLVVGILGTLWESIVVTYGWIEYASGYFNSYLPPQWIIAMWFLFATTLNVSLRWLRKSVFLSILCGGVFAPVAYYGGYRLGAVLFPDMTQALVIQGLGWSILLPLFFMIASRLERVQLFSTMGTLK